MSTFALALQVACSDDPPASQPVIPGASGSGAGTTTTAGTSSTAGSFGTSGSGGSSSGGTFGTAGTAGTEAGGMAGGGTGGAAAGTANGGTGGTVVVNPPLDCSKVAGKALPIPLVSTWGFPDSGDTSFSEAPILGGAEAVTAAGLPAGTADVWSMTWTPVTLGFVHWYWHNSAANWSGQGVCVDPTAKYVTLKAKAATAGVAAEFQAAGVKKVVTLTTEWQDVVIDLPAGFNAIHAAGGVNTGLVVVMAREAADTTARTIYWYNTQWTKELGGGGGEGGAGGGGGEGGAN